MGWVFNLELKVLVYHMPGFDSHLWLLTSASSYCIQTLGGSSDCSGSWIPAAQVRDLD